MPVTASLTRSVPGPILNASYSINESMGVFMFHSTDEPGVWTESSEKMLYIGNNESAVSEEQRGAAEFRYNNSHNAWVGWNTTSYDVWPPTGNYKPYYWPAGGSLIFTGYSPYYRLETVASGVDDAQTAQGYDYNLVPIENVSFNLDTKTLTIKDYVVGAYVPMSRDQIDDPNVEYQNVSQSDLMYFLPNLDADGNYVGVNGVYSSEVLMHHALSLVEFTVKANTEEDMDYVSLHRILLKGVYHKGDFSVTAGVEGSAKWELDPDNLKEDEMIFHAPDFDNHGRFEDGLMLDMDARTVAQLLVIPGVTHDIMVTSHVLVDGQTYENEFTFTPEEVGVKTWEIGKRYVYNITFGLNKITFSPETHEWTQNDGGISVQ